MKKLLLIIISIGFIGPLKAQPTSTNLTFNHLALSVKDVNRSAEFYNKVLSLTEITNRAMKTGMRWLSIGGNAELHLIKMENTTTLIDTAIHFAFATPNFDAFVKRINEMNIAFENSEGKPQTFNVRADGVKQIYFQDPDGYWIEVNNIGEKKRLK